MINFAQFRIIGRVGSITELEKVTHVSVASDRKVKDESNNWTTESNWNSITIFSEKMRKRLANQSIGNPGNQILFEGSIQSSAYEKDGEKVYKTSLVAQEFEVLSFTKSSK